MKIAKKTDTWYYAINERLFAGVFIVVRMCLAPFLLLYIYEGDNILFSSKLGFVFVIFISFFWGFKILLNVAVVVKEAFETRETKKDKNTVPFAVQMLYDITYAVDTNKKVRTIFGWTSFIVIVVLPIVYYGFVRGNLFRHF